MSHPRLFRRLTVDELSAWLAQHADVLVLDARDAGSHARGALPDAVRLHGGNQDELLLQTDRHRPVVIYCHHGQASRTWAQMFADFGFVQVADLVGGYAAWSAMQDMRTSPPI